MHRAPSSAFLAAAALAGLSGCWQSETLVLSDDPCAIAKNDSQAECEEGIVVFADARLEAAVREAIGKPTGAIGTADVAGLAVLDASAREIESLDGIQCLPSLQELDLHYNEISDLSPLAGAQGLTVLDLSDNNIDDLEPLECLTSLSRLYLYNNELSDLGPLADLAAMKELDLGHNRIDDLASLVGSTQPSKLYLVNNEITDLAPLADITTLTDLDLADNEITDLAPLVANEGLGDGDVVRIIGNPWDPWVQAENICALCNRGVELAQGSGDGYCELSGDLPWVWCL
jgi:internalin A